MLISVDPGRNGGLACSDEGVVYSFNMPDTPADLWKLILSMKTGADDFALIEQVGTYMPGNSGPAAVTFARHCGQIDMALIAAGIKHDTILPSKWEHWLIGKPNYPKIAKETPKKERRKILAKRKQERKNKIKAKVQCLYPELKITLKTSDALGILVYAMNNQKQLTI